MPGEKTPSLHTGGCRSCNGTEWLRGDSAASVGPTGPVRMYDGKDWPADRITWEHPALAHMMPISRKLWDAGNRNDAFHCPLIDRNGDPTMVTLLGVLYLENLPKADRVFGGQIDVGQLRSAKGNIDRKIAIFEDAIWKMANGDPDKLRSLLKSAVEQDAQCFRIQLKNLQAFAELAPQGLAPLRDYNGRPLVARVEADPDRDRKLHIALQDHSNFVRNTIKMYGIIGTSLTRRNNRQDAVAVNRPITQDQPGRSQRPVPSVMPVPVAVQQPVASRAPQAAIVVDTTPLQKVDTEIIAAIASARGNCLLTANVKCS